MQQIYGFTPSKSTVYEWVGYYSKLASKEVESLKAQTGSVWVADEMVLKVDGKNLWVWDVMDAKSRYLLASHASYTRNQRDAQTVFRQAAERAVRPPEVIITDKLAAYIEGIESVFGADAKHVPSGGIRAEVNNNLIERLHGTVRERTKVMRGLQDRETAQAFLDGWRLNYNYFRPHQSLRGKLPANVIGASAPFSNWADIARLEDRTQPYSPRKLRDTTFRVSGFRG